MEEMSLEDSVKIFDRRLFERSVARFWYVWKVSAGATALVHVPQKRRSYLDPSFHSDSFFIDTRLESSDPVWSYHVVVENEDLLHARRVDVWNPRLEPDYDEFGYIGRFAEWDRLTYFRTEIELSDSDYDLVADAVRELVEEDYVDLD